MLNILSTETSWLQHLPACDFAVPTLSSLSPWWWGPLRSRTEWLRLHRIDGFFRRGGTSCSRSTQCNRLARITRATPGENWDFTAKVAMFEKAPGSKEKITKRSAIAGPTSGSSEWYPSGFEGDIYLTIGTPWTWKGYLWLDEILTVNYCLGDLVWRN